MKMWFILPRVSNPFDFLYKTNKEQLDEFKTFQAKSNGPKNIEGKTILKIERNCMEDSCHIKWEDTQEFTFPIKGGHVIKVYDADTITIASTLPYDGSPLYRLSVRLNGIDTPEMKGKDVSDDEKAAAKSAREFVYNLVFNKFVRLENIESEKYGRILADVYIGDIHVNELLLKERYAVKYDGGTKRKPVSWLKYKLTGEY
jgi:micrococcal nuclease